MTEIQLFILALIQGITEFLPISSSGHLALMPLFGDWPDQGRSLDVAAHVGTLFAVLGYFWRDTKGLALAGFASVGVSPARRALQGTRYIQLFWALVIATLPLVMVGFMLSVSGMADSLRDPMVIGAAFIVFGIILFVADQRPIRDTQDPENERNEGNEGPHVPLKSALLIGVGQVFALIPGASRAGVTMTAARFLGMGREASARFSMLLSIPAIIASGTLVAIDLLKSGDPVALMDAALVAIASCGFAVLAIHILLAWLRRASMTVFVAYRVIVGIIILAAASNGWI